MPLRVYEGMLLSAGMWSVAAATFFYKKKQTLPFKLAYFASWPLLGSAILVTLMPDREEMQRELTSRGREPGTPAADVAAQLAALRVAANGGGSGLQAAAAAERQESES